MSEMTWGRFSFQGMPVLFFLRRPSSVRSKFSVYIYTDSVSYTFTKYSDFVQMGSKKFFSDFDLWFLRGEGYAKFQEVSFN